MIVNENKLENTPSGGALIGKRKGQTMIHNKGSMSGYLVGKTHAEGGIKAINKSTGQPLEMQGGEVVITAPAVSDQTKREFDGKMMTNREILSAINERGGGVAFAESGMEIPTEMHFNGTSYNYGGKMLSDHDIAYELSQCGCDHEMKNGGGVKTSKVVTYKDKYNRKYNYPKNTSHTLEEISKDTKVSMKGLRQIYNKGIGAYKTNPSSVRPNVKSKEQWAMARVYSAVMGGKASKVDSNELKMSLGGGILKIPNVSHSDLKGKEFTFQKGKFLIVDFPNYYGTWKKNIGASWRKTAKHYTSIVKLDNIKTDLDSILWKKFQKPFFVFDDYFNQFENKPSFSLDGDYKKMTDFLNYELKNFKNGGHILSHQRNTENLVKDAKRGNTPARDLNNYNDVMDLGADGEVGDANGLAFAKGGDLSFLDDIDNVFYGGGTIGNEKVINIKISQARYTYEDDLIGKEYSNFNEFKLALRESFVKNKEQEGWVTFRINTSFNTLVIDFKKAKNTVKNFNPLTGTADDFEKQLLRKDSYTYFKYDWNDWYSGNVSSSALASFSTNLGQQVKNIFSPNEILEIDQLPDNLIGANPNRLYNLPPTIVTLINLREFEIKGRTQALYLSDSFEFDKTIEGKDFWEKISSGDFTEFKKMYGSGASASTTSTSKTLTKDEVIDTKIWFGDNIALRDAIVEKLTALGLPLDSRYPINADDTYIKVYSYDFICTNGDKANFDADYKNEIFPADLGIDVNNFSASASTAIATKKLTKDDLKNTKIWIGNNPDLSKKVQEKFFELGITWMAGSNLQNNNLDSLFVNDTNNMLKSNEGRDFFDSQSEKEIFESDLFGLQSNAINNKMPTDFSKLPKSRMAVLFEIKKFVDDNKLTPNPFTFDALEKVVPFIDEETGDVFDFTFGDGSLNPSSQEARDLLLEFLDFEKGFDSFVAKKTQDLKNDIADLDLLAISEVKSMDKEMNDLQALKMLLPSFQGSKFANERASILKEMGRLHKKINYERFISVNENLSSPNQLFTPQGLLKYYYTQTTQSPVSPLEPACELPTPNGEKSKLPLSTYFNVRTTRFKKWFGDWEKAYETNNYVDCSKMIDEETKEPKIFYHGVRKYVPNFGQFSNMGQGVVRPYGSFEPPTAFPASYFSDSEEYAKFYGGEAPNMPKPSDDYEPFIYKVFLSAKNPISLLPLGFESSYKDMIDYLLVAYGVRVEPSRNVLNRIQNDMKAKHPLWVYVRNDVVLLETIKEYGYDALIQTGDIPTFDQDGNVIDDRSKFIQDEEYLTFYPTQVKSATVKKSFYFDFFKDIRFKQGGYVRI